MLAIAVTGPLFFLLVLTMPLTKSGGGSVRTAAVDEHAPRAFLPYARANPATLLCVFGSIFAMAVAMNSGMMWFRSEEHTSELQSLMRISYAVFCLQKTQTFLAVRNPTD